MRRLLGSDRIRGIRLSFGCPFGEEQIRTDYVFLAERNSLRVPFVEPVEAQRKTAPNQLTPNAGGSNPSAFGVFAYISRDFEYPPVHVQISGLGEIIRGPVVTLWVSPGPRTSRGKTLALSRRDSKRVKGTVTTAPRMNLRTSGPILSQLPRISKGEASCAVGLVSNNFAI